MRKPTVQEIKGIPQVSQGQGRAYLQSHVGSCIFLKRVSFSSMAQEHVYVA